jgi:hypothetical protein
MSLHSSNSGNFSHMARTGDHRQVHSARAAPRLPKPPDRFWRHGHAGRQPDGHSKIETTKNIYGHLFAQDRASILKAMNRAVTRLYVEDGAGEQAA